MITDYQLDDFASLMFDYISTRLMTPQSEEVEEENDNFHTLVREVAKAVDFILVYLGKTFRRQIEEDFSRFELKGDSILEYILKSCEELYSWSYGVFESFLKMSAFVFEVSCFCSKKGIPDCDHNAPYWWEKVFTSQLKKEFLKEGGWENLKQKIDECTRRCVQWHKVFLRHLEETKLCTDDGANISKSGYFKVQPGKPKSDAEEHSRVEGTTPKSSNTRSPTLKKKLNVRKLKKAEGKKKPLEEHDGLDFFERMIKDFENIVQEEKGENKDSKLKNGIIFDNVLQKFIKKNSGISGIKPSYFKESSGQQTLEDFDPMDCEMNFQSLDYEENSDDAEFCEDEEKPEEIFSEDLKQEIVMLPAPKLRASGTQKEKPLEVSETSELDEFLTSDSKLVFMKISEFEKNFRYILKADSPDRDVNC